MSEKLYVSSNFNFCVETESLLKVIGGHVHCKMVIFRKSCKIETSLLQFTNRKCYNDLCNRINPDDLE